MKNIILTVFFLLTFSSLKSQEVLQHVSYESIYNFLDELASEKIIKINSAIKPYSRKFISEKLKQVGDSISKLNQRQKEDLVFFLQDYNRDLLENLPPSKRNIARKDSSYFFSLNSPSFFYKDKLFSFSLKPLLGLQYFINDSGKVTHRWVGAEFHATAGKHWSAYASLRDNSFSRILSQPEYLNQMPAGSYKVSSAESDFSEMRGGLLYSWNWGSFGILKDHFVWGDNYNGANIFSGHTPSFAHIRLQVKPAKWIEFNYIHGWLVSGVLDSNRSFSYTNSYGTAYRAVYHDKYIAANMFSIIPFKNFNFSFGNSIVYSDMGVRLEYLIPFLFYKSVDHSLNEASNNLLGQNSQMFINISSRQIKHTHIYTSIFVDEINIHNMFNNKEHSNFVSGKFGINVSNFPFQNIMFCAEYTASNPLVYKHIVPTTTFETNQYNLGHYLTDNSQEYFFRLSFKPIRGLNVQCSYLFAQHGPDYTSLGSNRLGLPFMDKVKWQNETFSLKTIYEVINDLFISLEYNKSNINGPEVIIYTPSYFVGKLNTLILGFNLGF